MASCSLCSGSARTFVTGSRVVDERRVARSRISSTHCQDQSLMHLRLPLIVSAILVKNHKLICADAEIVAIETLGGSYPTVESDRVAFLFRASSARHIVAR